MTEAAREARLFILFARNRHQFRVSMISRV